MPTRAPNTSSPGSTARREVDNHFHSSPGDRRYRRPGDERRDGGAGCTRGSDRGIGGRGLPRGHAREPGEPARGPELYVSAASTALEQATIGDGDRGSSLISPRGCDKGTLSSCTSMTMHRMTGVPIRPKRRVVSAELREGRGGVLTTHTSRRARWWRLQLECAHTVERPVEYRALDELWRRHVPQRSREEVLPHRPTAYCEKCEPRT